jgi:ATP-binding cassette, subfamily B, bacterial
MSETPFPRDQRRGAGFTRERRAFRIANLRGREFWLGSAAWLVFFVYPLIPGALIRAAYGALQADERTKFLLFAGLVVLAEVGMATILAFGHSTYMAAFEAVESLVKGNVLHARLSSGGADAAPREVSSGDVVTRLRDDPKDLIMLVDNWIDVFGSSVFGIAALAMLARIDALAAFVMLVPLFLFGYFNRFAGNRLRRVRSAAREATSDATDYLNSAFGGALTVKVTGSQRGVLRRIDELNARRSHTMVRDQTVNEGLWALNGSVGDICIGCALVVAARRLDHAGDVALFAAYAMNLIWLPQKIGGALVGRRRFDVAADRVDSLLPDPASASSAAGPVRDDLLVVARPLPILGGPKAPPVQRPALVPLERLTVRALMVAERGLDPVSFELKRGTLNVVSGPVGSGKSSLLRALIGLLEIDSGEVLWNGRVVSDRAAFFVPPQCAFVAQVPHLFSDTLEDNLLLGFDTDPEPAIRMAAFDRDVADLRYGLATRVGAGGVRLSGGQAQRAAAARALVHDTELVVLDDLTSALDVETEVLLWNRLAESGRTVLAVSNRPVAIARADQVIELQARG